LPGPGSRCFGRADPPLRLAQDDQIQNDFLLGLALFLGGLGLAGRHSQGLLQPGQRPAKQPVDLTFRQTAPPGHFIRRLFLQEVQGHKPLVALGECGQSRGDLFPAPFLFHNNSGVSQRKWEGVLDGLCTPGQGITGQIL
jgi:hypothetical protein